MGSQEQNEISNSTIKELGQDPKWNIAAMVVIGLAIFGLVNVIKIIAAYIL